MGLDGVELLMDVEGHFGITIRDSEASSLCTVGDLVSLVQSRLIAAQSASCPTLAAFLSLRACVREITSNGQLRLRPRTRLQDALLPAQRQQLWKQLEVMLGTHPPGLRRPKALRRLLGAIALTSILIAIRSASAIDWSLLPLTLMGAALLIGILERATIGFRVLPPNELATFGDLAKRLAGLHVANHRLEMQTFEEVLEEVRPIVAEALGVAQSQVVAEARFVQDLGMG